MASSNAAQRKVGTSSSQTGASPLELAFEPYFETDGSHGARSLQQRLHEVYGSAAQGQVHGDGRRLSPMVQLAIIVTVSCSLWALVAVAVRAAI